MLAKRRKRYATLFGVCSAFVAVFLTFPQPTTNARPRASALVEEGVFLLHKFEQPIGEEKYSVQQDGDEQQLSVSFHFDDRSTGVPLDAYVRMGRD